MLKKYTKELKVFKGLYDPNRLAILEILSKGEQCGSYLLKKLKLTQPGLSYHMKVLVESKIVVARPDGKWTYYSISKNGTAKAIELIKSITKMEI